MNNFVLGLWDGHDAGACILFGENIIAAINEERLSRRKLEVGFPYKSIKACLDYADVLPDSIKEIAVSTTDPAKTLTRIFPKLKEEYYLIRRRKKEPKKSDFLKKWFKYRFTELAPNPVSVYLSEKYLKKELNKIGFKNYNLSLINHHIAHACTASYCSGQGECLVITIDGVGDGLSGSISIFKDKKLKIIQEIPAKTSMGIFFEHVTNLMNMRELEDEGKVMALANYAYPVFDSENPLMPLIYSKGLSFVSPYNSTSMFYEMKKIFWRYPSEQFAYMAQQVLEKNIILLVKEAVSNTQIHNLALAGGVFSNIKLNMKIGELDDVKNYYVFPHMGDGGLAIGAAICTNQKKFYINKYKLTNLYFGSTFDKNHILNAIKNKGVLFSEIDNISQKASDLILNGEIILWFHGRSEIGPRALGNRSILARPDNIKIKDKLNLALKKRVWYQPFCPSMLLEDAEKLLYIKGQTAIYNPFMTAGFKVKEEHLKVMEGVINVDGTCRPQFVSDENMRYRDLLRCIKKVIGYGVILNTSLNVHGEPMVYSPEDAIDTLFKTGVRYLFMEDFLIENPNPKNI